MGDCLLTTLLGDFSDKGHRFSQATTQFDIQSGYVGDNLAETKIGILILDYLHD